MNIQRNYLQVIRETYPDINISSFEFNNHGQNSNVVVINKEFIFRFPKYPHVLERLRRETVILNRIQGYVTLAVPVPMFLNLEQKVGKAFFGYRIIPGEPLWRETFRKIDNQDVIRRLADQVAIFLKALHGVPVDELLMSESPVDTYEGCAEIYSRIQDKLFGYMRPDAREWVENHFQDFLGNVNNFEYKPVLKHGDFGPSNILFSKEKQRINGVIDFSSSGIGDPAYDFAGLLSGYGDGFVEYCGNHYPEVGSFMRRIRFYQGTFALLEALFGVENGDEDALRAGLEKYV